MHSQMKQVIYSRAVDGDCLNVQFSASPVTALAVVATGDQETSASGYRMVLSVRRRIQWGTGRFCFIFLPRMRFVLKDLWDGYKTRVSSVYRHVGEEECKG